MRKNSQVLVVEERVQKVKLDPKYCVFHPLACLSDFLHAKVNSKCQVHYLFAIALRTFVYP